MADENQKWLSSKLEASLMEALDEKAKSIGLSRSEAVRRAIQQWTDDSSEPATGSSAEILQRLERIERKLDPSASTEEASYTGHESADDRTAEDQSEQEGLSSVQMYEGDELLDWIEKEGEKSAEHNAQQTRGS